jgi:hypothetical protein
MAEHELSTIRFRWKKLDWTVTVRILPPDEDDCTDITFVEVAAADLNGHLICNELAKKLINHDKQSFVTRSITQIHRKMA